jgi:hypothetical protein
VASSAQQGAATDGGTGSASSRAIGTTADTELAELRAQLAAREGEVRALKRELGIEQQRRFDREHDWLEYNRWLARLPLGEAGRNLTFPLDPSVIPPPAPVAESKPAPAQPSPEFARATELLSRINALLWSDGVRDLALLEAGRLWPDLAAPRSIGPVVLRRLDGEGRLAGSLYGERMRLECSRAARTVTLVLEGGYELVDGARFAFEPTGRRILLPLVDPDRWLEGCPELFASTQQLAGRDDGLWNRKRVKDALNALLSADAATGYWQIQDIGGIVGTVLRDVRLMALDRSGHWQRYAFCDELRIAASASGIEFALRDGAVVRDGRKAPFPEGRMRILLPHASAAEFRAARVPGFGDPDLLPGFEASRAGAAVEPPSAVDSAAPVPPAAPPPESAPREGS